MILKQQRFQHGIDRIEQFSQPDDEYLKEILDGRTRCGSKKF
jgi:hypothetical protein